mmetsp:Transcript_8772/g.12506  ORF Transcript_8772/g.12506 Transcript_8772/m.12506 type:complete len:313 (+) Transcript_8772:384-1322(+)
MVSKVAVLGATGQQGGAVTSALSAAGIPVIAITRKPDSDKAKALASKPNIEVRKADLNDVDSLVAAFEGCDGAFVIANFWEGMSATKEMEQYKNAADALKKISTMKHVVFSTLEDTYGEFSKDFKIIETSEEYGAMTVPHFDGKSRSEKFFEGLPTTFVVTSCYFENFTSFFSLVKGEDGSYSFTLPLGDKKIPWTILADLGTVVTSTLQTPSLIGQHIGHASFFASGNDIAEMFSKATGKTVKYNCVSWETFASFGFPGSDELAQMFEFWLRTYEDFCNARCLDKQKEMFKNASFTEPIGYAKTLPLNMEA